MADQPRHPVQPMFLDQRDGGSYPRFQGNAIVRYLLDMCGERGVADLNSLARAPFDQEDRVQFAQLIGYSLGGFSELSYVDDDSYERASMLAKSVTTSIPGPRPMQPLVFDSDGIVRFKRNAIVRYLVDVATSHKVTNLNMLAILDFSGEDRNQFAQLLGWSVSRFGDTQFADAETIRVADSEAHDMRAAKLST